MGLTRCLGIMYMMIPLLLLRMTLAAPTFNRTVGEVQVGTCAGLKKNVEFGLDLTVIVTSDLLCAETITLSQGQDVSIVSEPPQQYAIAIAEDFPVPDPTSATLIVNPKSAYLSLEQLLIVNEAGSAGSPGAVRAISNAGSLDINACSFVGLNYATRQDGGAIYSVVELGSGVGSGSSAPFVSVRNSSFVGNVASEYGGAIVAGGAGAVEVSNCSFLGNEALGIGEDKRSGSGGAIYAYPGAEVSVLNSSFEGCFGRYGGAALYMCGGEIVDSTFAENEAPGLFGTVVNGDLSDEARLEATKALGATTPGQNYTCPLLSISGTIFDSNSLAGGYGGGVASIDASLSVFNSSFLGNLGGAMYFGTSSLQGRDQLELELVQFNQNSGSDASLDSVAAAFFVELTGREAANATGEVEDVVVSSSTSSSAPASGATVQAVTADSNVNVGTGRDIFCFQNEPYDCEIYFGQATLQLTESLRCSACRGDAFTGIGSPAGAPTPAPAAFDDDDGLSQAGQERAQGGTPSPTPVGGVTSSSTTDGTGDGTRGGSGSGSDADTTNTDEPELLGVTGGTRWVVVGLIAGLGGALMVCFCLVTVCRVSSKKTKTKDSDEEMRSAQVAPRHQTPSNDGDDTHGGFGLAAAGGGAAGARDGAAPESPLSNSKSHGNLFFAVSPGGTTAVNKRESSIALSGTDSRRGSRSSSFRGTPLSQRRSREVARQRVIQMSAEADKRAEEDYWGSPPPGRGGSGVGTAAVTGTPSRKGFAALPASQKMEAGYEDESEPYDYDNQLARQVQPAGSSAQQEIPMAAAAGAAGAGTAAAGSRGRREDSGRAAAPPGTGRRAPRGDRSKSRERSTSRARLAASTAAATNERSDLSSGRSSRSRTPPNSRRDGGSGRIRTNAFGGSSSRSRSPVQETSDGGRSRSRAVRTPAGGARLPITSAAPSRASAAPASTVGSPEDPFCSTGAASAAATASQSAATAAPRHRAPRNTSRSRSRSNSNRTSDATGASGTSGARSSSSSGVTRRGNGGVRRSGRHDEVGDEPGWASELYRGSSKRRSGGRVDSARTADSERVAEASRAGGYTDGNAAWMKRARERGSGGDSGGWAGDDDDGVPEGLL